MERKYEVIESEDYSLKHKPSGEARKSSYFTFENDQFGNQEKTEKKEFSIISIGVEKTRINRIFGVIKSYDDDIYIFHINGRTDINPNIPWKVYKKYKQVKEVFEQMKKELSKKSLTDEYITIHAKMVKNYSENEFDNNLANIGKYIMTIYNGEIGKQLESLNEFLRISATSFSYINGVKPFEGYALKKAEPRFMRTLLKYVVYPVEFWLFKGWNKRWIVLKEDMISYLNTPTTLTGKNVYWFDESMEVTAIQDKLIEIKNLSRVLLLKFDTIFERDLWKKEIEQRIAKITDGITNNVYSSFTSQKMHCGAKWFVDGESYFSYLLNQLKGAKESVYITDWFMSPELALKRPICYYDFVNDEEYQKNLTFGNVSRLMDILYLLAKKGVKIYILLYCEVSLALGINSAYTKSTLKKLHPNILITRHPKNDTTLLWSHHEKLVIIDQKMAFVGGLDLCWGRYDSNKHPIVEEETLNHIYYYPGCDYINERQVDLHDVDKFYKEQLDRNSMPRMAWHDVHTMVEGPIVGDIVRHFIERWNDARFNRRDKGLVSAGTCYSFDAVGINKKDLKKKEKERKKKEKEKKKEEKEKTKKKVFLTKKFTMVENRNFINQEKYEAESNMNDIKEEEDDNDNDENKKDNNEENKEKNNNDENKDNDNNDENKTNDNAEEKKLDDIEEKKLDDIEEKKLDDIEEKKLDDIEEKKLDDIAEKKLDEIEEKNLDDIEEKKLDDILEKKNENNETKEDTNNDKKTDMPKTNTITSIDSEDFTPIITKESDNVFHEKHEGFKHKFDIFGFKDRDKPKQSELKRQNTNKYKVMKIKQKIFFGDDDAPKDQSINKEYNIQALRSVSEWSIGKSKKECSILTGYYKLIDNAKHYIYIENQFFITKSYSEDERKESGLNLNKLVKNEIGLHIRSRIERAYEEKTNFKVFICIPLLPGFSGTPGESSTMNGVLKHTFQSIAHNKGMSLLEQLRKKMGDDVNKYIYFFSLRNHGKIKGVPVTELIYIHSKLLIVDDEKVLIGSANINDRSMKGSRDSEFAVIIEQQNKVESVMNNQKYMASEYARSLRKHLMAEHMGFDINDKILDDPLNDDLWIAMKSRAKLNSIIYRDIFDCFPDNKFKTFADLKKRKIIKTEKDKEELKKRYDENISGINGHIVEYPVEFLSNEELDIDFFSKENLIPEKNFC